MSRASRRPGAAVGLVVVWGALATPPAAAEEAKAAPTAVERSRAAEERGFASVDKEAWCEAYGAFLEANHFAPSVDLIFNAAQAADLAGDKKAALQLYADLLGAYPGSERQAQVNQRLVELTQALQKEGPGKACPTPALPPPSAGAADAPLASPPSQAEPATSSAPAGDPAAAEPSPTGPAASDDGGVSGVGIALAAAPWTLAGVGAGVGALGGALLIAGLVPFFGHAQVRQQILDAEATRADASALQSQQAAYRGAWESWGEPALFSGAALLGLGAATLVAGLAWGGVALAFGGAPDEEGAPGPDVAESKPSPSEPSSDEAPPTEGMSP